MYLKLKKTVLSVLLCISVVTVAQVTPNINSGNPKFPFPQFLDYGPDRKSLASKISPGVTHAEMEQRTREAWRLVCNNTSPYPGNVVVSGVQYLYPTAPNHCTCAEGDGYYLLGAALMGDKPYFDGYYMWAHDRSFNGVKRFIDGVNNPYGNYSRGLSYSGSFGAGTNVLGGGISGNSAADGDVDIALALLIAYKQWGENSGIVLNHGGWGGKEINYKEEALNYIKAMVDTSIFAPALPMRNYVTGIIGLDGYMKRGDSWGELTPWALGGYLGMRPQTSASNAHYIDYNAPAWFKQFADFLDDEGERTFLINQYRRAEASSDWLMGLHYSKDPRNISYMGKVDYVSPTDFAFSNYIPDGEDFRGPWRTAMNYVWHGNPNYTWNPSSHQVIQGTPNSYQYDMAVRYAQFLKNQQGSPWNNPCRNIGDLAARPLTFKGPYTLLNGYFPNGTINGGAFPLNWIHGAGAASAIAAQDFELMGDMFRHCVIAWDAATGTNLNSRPVYFHEFFRLIGMLTLAGNFHAPNKMIPQANLKVYHKVDKTVAFTGDLVTFTVSIRNYGSVDGLGTVVKFGIPKDFQFVSSNKGSLAGDTVVWNKGVATGFKTGGLNATIDSMKIILRVGSTANGRYCTNARVSVTNGVGWVSDEYPNNITAVMERNCVDVATRALKIEKTANRRVINPDDNGDVIYKIKFQNSSEAGWLNGGRPGVRLSFASEPMTNPTSEAANVLKFRLFHDAAEAYIDYGNYRVSYFMNDNSIKCYTGDAGCTLGWQLQNTIAEGVVPTNVTVTHENIVPGSDANGSWNQRIVLQFSKQLATVTQHLQQYAGSPNMVHEGGTAVLRGVWRLFPSNYTNVNWADDWSWGPTFTNPDNGLFHPIGDDYTDPDNLGLPIDSWHKSACQTTTNIMKKILVEEWDGYVWRRVLGNGPVPGRDVDQVLIRDTLPLGVTFKNFIRQNP
ncbi:MAG: glycosyl hydrolase family 8, partial [Cytophagales bacterium]